MKWYVAQPIKNETIKRAVISEAPHTVMPIFCAIQIKMK